MLVYFLRHANAGKKRLNQKADEKRPLDKEGIEQCRYMGRFLRSLDVHVDLIVSSPLKRATQTASLVGNEIDYEAKIELSPALRPTATFESFRELLRSCAGMDSIMVVGHNPTMSEFLAQLVSAGKTGKGIEMKKGSVARVEYTAKKSTLTWLIAPKLAKAIYTSAETTSSRPKTSRK